MRKLLLFLISIAVISSCSTNQQKSKEQKSEEQTAENVKKAKPVDISMYPKAEENQLRHIIELAPLEDEANSKVEIYVAKEMEVDCNTHSLSGNLDEKELTGWGYNYYVFETNGQIISSLMACPDNTLTKKDVLSQSKLLRYNSKVPIVIYSPKSYEVKYKIWSASKQEHTAKVK